MTKAAQVTIKFALHEGCRGGGTLVQCSHKATPRNLMRAVDMLESITRDNDRAFGNVGHAGTWIEIAGKTLDDSDLYDLQRENVAGEMAQYRRDKIQGYAMRKPLNRTERAANIIARYAGPSSQGV